jgi:SM-20-related protein
MSDTLLNIPLLKQTPVKTTPFPYLVIPNFIQPEYLAELVDSFPVIDNRGSIPASSVSCKPIFKRLVNELEGMDLRYAIAEKFLVDLNRKPTLLTLRGHVNERDGHIHTDSKSKLITLLLYMNASWDADTGMLRLLNSNKSLDHYVEEISPLAGSCLIFKVTDNCWHGHKVYIGKRLSLQLNYVIGKSALTKHLNHHRLSARLKQCLKYIVTNVGSRKKI